MEVADRDAFVADQKQEEIPSPNPIPPKKSTR